ncbi:MAG: zinc ribbon domain-containing protein [Chloroflexota bacterium]
MTLPIIILVTLGFLFVAYPFFRSKPEHPATEDGGDGGLDDLRSRRDTTYSMLKEVQFDYQSGILTEEDYKDLETRYKARAITLLKDMDGLAAAESGDDEIEKRVRALRRTANAPKEKGDIEDEIEKRVRALRRKNEPAVCPGCGEKRPEGARFCPSCGQSLQQEVRNP